MKVLLVGGGGREHALARTLSRSPLLTRLWCAPGNPGIAEVATCVPIRAEDIGALVAFARDQAVDLVVCGPEAPLTLGLADRCAEAGLRCFGPSAAAARLEGSKSFTKEICDAAGVPTARWARFTDSAAARDHLRVQGAPIVVKADGLAAGKGVVVAQSVAEAEAAVAAMMDDRAHGEAGAAVVIEECLLGEEISFFALCDGTQALPLAAAQDHKRVGEGDTGPNTGGMGAYSPAPAFTEALRDEVMARMIRPTLAEMAKRGTPFRGVLFAGLMLTAEGPKLIEYNVRFGDPECQVLCLRLRGDLLAALLAACEGGLDAVALDWSPDPAVVVVMAARGYPGTPLRGTAIGGLDAAAAVPGATVFQASTVAGPDGTVLADGGRVLGIAATAGSLREARDAAYAAVDALRWPEGFCRRDIGWRALG
ncbi:phosphoribosylamine--glycine ligase [Roseomonas sp. BN140053]|uniref:phosphoribosylamine--glycine ligase n=1 Tax=Roseomonas sp. BN140053 TaxID=3391898 RepID=UPI0039EB95E0